MILFWSVKKLLHSKLGQARQLPCHSFLDYFFPCIYLGRFIGYINSEKEKKMTFTIRIRIFWRYIQYHGTEHLNNLLKGNSFYLGFYNKQTYYSKMIVIIIIMRDGKRTFPFSCSHDAFIIYNYISLPTQGKVAHVFRFSF